VQIRVEALLRFAECPEHRHQLAAVPGRRGRAAPTRPSKGRLQVPDQQFRFFPASQLLHIGKSSIRGRPHLSFSRHG
jgi:hypothetical protein